MPAELAEVGVNQRRIEIGCQPLWELERKPVASSVKEIQVVLKSVVVARQPIGAANGRRNPSPFFFCRESLDQNVASSRNKQSLGIRRNYKIVRLLSWLRP